MRLKATWANASINVRPMAKHIAEARYEQWMDALVDGDIDFLKDAYNNSSHNHREYAILDAKARIGISSFMPPHEAGHAHFVLSFEDD